MTSFTTLKIDESKKNIMIVTLHRPKVRNAINSVMMQELDQFWHIINQNPGQWRCIILTGSESAFCAGADLKERKNISLEQWKAHHLVFERAMMNMVECPIPVIGAVNGSAFGGGLEMVLACDFSYASSEAQFAQSETKWGLMPGAMGTQHLPQASGMRRAKELTFTGAPFSVDEAYAWGIINRICEPEELMDSVFLTAHDISENAPLAIQSAKKAINLSQALDIKSGYRAELDAYNRLLTTKDREEGIHAFNEKRKPVFLGE